MPIAEYAASAASLTPPANSASSDCEVVDVDGDAGLLHQREQVDQRQLDLGQQPAAAALLDLVVERVGEVDDSAGVEHRGVGGVGGHRVVEGVEGQLALISTVGGSCFSSRLR